MMVCHLKQNRIDDRYKVATCIWQTVVGKWDFKNHFAALHSLQTRPQQTVLFGHDTNKRGTYTLLLLLVYVHRLGISSITIRELQIRRKDS